MSDPVFHPQAEAARDDCRPARCWATPLELMVDKEIGTLIADDDRYCLAGILTERDYLTKVVGIIADYARQPLAADP